MVVGGICLPVLIPEITLYDCYTMRHDSCHALSGDRAQQVTTVGPTLDRVQLP
jgi:hypothetical protein